MSKEYKLILVDDHCMFRDSLKFVLAQAGNIDIIAEASDGREFLTIIDHTLPDLVLMDISMPRLNGIGATKEAIVKYPDLKIIALSMFGEEQYYHKMLQAGAKGFVLKESGSDELLMAITTVMKGNFYFSKEILNNMIRNISANNNVNGDAIHKHKLSEREIEILKLICQGLSNVEIAEKLSISQRTVEGHRSKIIDKTEARSSIHLVLYAVKNKLIDI